MVETSEEAVDVSCFRATCASLIISSCYVGSLYIWRSDQDRDHPETIKRRFLSAFCTMWISPAIAYAFIPKALMSKFPFYQLIGFRQEGILPAIVLPLLLTVILFAGPIAMVAVTRFRWFFRLDYWLESFQDLIWWRNYVVAPLTEEFAFRACMLPILLGYFTPQGATIICPLFFGCAHFHHMIERVRNGQDFQSAAFISLFQFAYTTVFGIYSAYLFIRTGHFISCVLVHGFCNFMGFPDFGELMGQEPKKRLYLSLIFVSGLAAFFFVMAPLTEPSLYKNTIYSW